MSRMIAGPRAIASVLAGLTLGASSPAVAWQPPKADAAQQVRACPEMGEGFVRLPGSDTCIKLAGSVRVEVMKQSGGGSAVADH